MYCGVVIGRVVSTNKFESLKNKKLMIVRRMNHEWQLMDESTEIVAVDSIGAGIGEWVLYATGSSARAVFGENASGIDAAIVGIIDPNEQG